jgi:hypothetical protein
VLVGAYVFGDLIERPAEVEFVQMAFVLDVDPGEVAWGIRPSSLDALAYWLEIDKGAVGWFWRPSAWPVANHYIVRPLRVWSGAGPDDDALDALERGAADDLRVPAPGAAELREQLGVELEASLAHLRRVSGGYWERDWRREHRGSGRYPENHLWDATSHYLELLDATRNLSP